MRLLHTSDWHLGLSSGPASRLPDHRYFFDWLIAACEEHAVDVLLVSGDIFDTMQPSAEALREYYRLLTRLASSAVRDVVIVGGNHDSASRLEAPAEVLHTLNVHVVGGLRSDPETWSDCLVPLRRRGSDEPAAICLAVPYIHEFRLGIRTTEENAAGVKARFIERFSELYTELCDLAASRWPGLPVIATGHLTISGAPRDSYPLEIHRVAFIDGLPPSIFDSRIRYVALGHIHQPYPTGDPRVRYSGSPIPHTVTEASPERRVLLVDVDEDQGEPVITPLLVPTVRGHVILEGPPEEVVTALKALTWSTPLPPLVHVRVDLESPEPGLAKRLHEASGREHGDAPVLASVRQLERAPEFEELPAPKPLELMTPRQVFDQLLRAREIVATEALQSAFDELASADDAWLAERIRALQG